MQITNLSNNRTWEKKWYAIRYNRKLIEGTEIEKQTK